MGSQPLARVADPKALDDAQGPKAQLLIAVPEKWLRNGALVEVVVPKRLHCGRCEGGGCDSCARAGVWRTPKDTQQRTLRVQLPANHAAGVRLRLVHPFRDCAIEQLIVSVSAAPNPSKGVRKLAETSVALVPQRPGRQAANTNMVLLVTAAIALALALFAWL